MNRAFWLLANVCLAAVAVVVTEWVTTLEPGKGTDAGSQTTRTGKRNSARSQPRRGARETSAIDSGFSLKELDELWEHTLFRPERTEDVPKAEDEETEKEPEAVVDMELIGIGIIADKRAAIILVKSKAPVRRSTRTRSRTPVARTRGGARTKAEPSPEKKRQRVYKVGQQIEDTGYEVKEIEIDEVLLVRGDEERVLKLEAGDEQSESRRDSAAKAAEKAKEEAKEVAAKPATDAGKKDKKDVSMPPPPPPMALPGATPGTGSPSTTTPSREERIQRAREIRDRLLQSRKVQGKN